MRIKICGITTPEQGNAIAKLGATALGFICVQKSPRYLPVPQIKEIVKNIPAQIDRIGVFANADITEIITVVTGANLNSIQLHGDESPQFCQDLRQLLPQVELIKAFRIKSPETLTQVQNYTSQVDTLLLDAYHPQQLGGTGKTLNWNALREFTSPLPWFLAGGLTADNIQEALQQLQPDGIDLSSGVERKPGDKDLQKVAQLFSNLKLLRKSSVDGESG